MGVGICVLSFALLFTQVHDDGRNDLMRALDSGKPEEAMRIIDGLDASIKSAVQQSLNTPGVWRELGSIFPLLAAANAKLRVLSAVDRMGWTPLMLAAAHGYVDVVKRLIDADVPRDARNTEGLTATAIAEKAGHSEIVALLAGPRPK